MGEIYPEDDFFKEKDKGGSKKTTALDNFGQDITKLASENKLDPVIGREDEIHRVIQILGRRKKNKKLSLLPPNFSLHPQFLSLKLLHNIRLVFLD